jgi:hypothetical protein
VTLLSRAEKLAGRATELAEIARRGTRGHQVIRIEHVTNAVIGNVAAGG